MREDDTEHPKNRGRASRLLSGRSKRGDAYEITRDKGGCYDCTRLIGTILNVRTEQIVAICLEHQISNAPPAKEGCWKSTLMLRGVTRGMREKCYCGANDWFWSNEHRCFICNRCLRVRHKEK